jgi:hypothetical protein
MCGRRAAAGRTRAVAAGLPVGVAFASGGVLRSAVGSAETTVPAVWGVAAAGRCCCRAPQPAPAKAARRAAAAAVALLYV